MCMSMCIVRRRRRRRDHFMYTYIIKPFSSTRVYSFVDFSSLESIKGKEKFVIFAINVVMMVLLKKIKNDE